LTAAVTAGSTRVEVLGVRHHGPGSARSVAQALDEVRPDLVVVEGVPELDDVVALAGDPEMVPPVAGLVYAVNEPRRALFYPMAEFSPEWVAIRWALAHGVPVRFADLPATHQLAPQAETPPEDDEDADVEPVEPSRVRSDPLGSLAAAAGYDDPERWWEDAVEHRASSSLGRFDAVRSAMAELRQSEEGLLHPAEVAENARREAAMRRVLRAALKQEHDAIVVVCGAYHAPALVPDGFPPATHDTRLLTQLPRTKVAATWAPWTSRRLAVASGYGAGVRAPGWYQHLFRHWSTGGADADRGVASSWLVRVARELRRQELDAAPASVVEASRLADALAAVRGRPSVGLTELDDATVAVLCEGSDLPLQLVHRELTVGSDLGTVPETAPVVPLAADLARLQRSLRLKPSATETEVTLDLRRDAGRARSTFLHRLNLLGVPWGTPTEEGWRTTGTFKEVWRLSWEPEYAVLVIEASLNGTTVSAASESRMDQLAQEATDVATLSGLVSLCLTADLPGALDGVIGALEELTAQQHDTVALLRAVEPLARTMRYGDVRGVDTAALDDVLRTIVARASVGLSAACAGVDDDGAGQVREAVDGTARGLALLDDENLIRPWREALLSIAGQDSLHGLISGRVNRMLLDGGQVDTDLIAQRMSRRLSVAAPAPASAAWLEGFLSGESVILVHDRTLLGIVDDWVSNVAEDTFEDLLPLVRRTFAQFQPGERRVIAEQLRRAPGAPAAATGTTYDLERARPAVALVAALLGLEEES